MSLSIRVIDTDSGFSDIQKDWDTLYDNCNAASIFSSWDWMHTWWEVFKETLKSELFIVCLYDQDNLVGLAPFHIVSTFPKSWIQGKTLCFIGSGEEKKDMIVTQFNDFIVADGYQDQMVDQMSYYLENASNKWSFADFEFLLKNSLIAKCFSTADTKIIKEEVHYGVRFTVSGMTDFEQYQSKMGKRWKKMFAKKSRILSRDGEVTTKVTEDSQSIDELFDLLSKMHSSRWNDRTKLNIFDSKIFRDFHLKALKCLVPKGKAFIKTLYLDEMPLATYYCFVDKGVIHYYQSGFYSENANRYSPLFILVCNEIGESIKNNQVFDFMFSDAGDSYKKEQYAAETEPMYRLRWSPHKYRFTLFNIAKFIQLKILKVD
ncbi:GNAT family N-acetyltransferase [uncultured Cocleimonas sp.]|uniref:GNAT family N-acetyltransferase n=1 Tax=uncultured Cocleimonas sp. TaxID=1051587 RepID=UPI0026190F60|nr:GNAT family N-acetyltransferase [uncultured Cocleimonas sp.]